MKPNGRKTAILLFCLSLFFSIGITSTYVGTVHTIDALAYTYFYNGPPPHGLMTAWGGPGYYLSAQYEAQGTNRVALISSLSSLVYDKIYLSMTEIRTDSNAVGVVGVYYNNGDLPTPEMINGIGDPVAQQAWESGFTYFRNISGIGVAGNYLLFDVSGVIQLAISAGWNSIGFLLRDTNNDNRCIGILGKNYNSGDPTQYYAWSLYEYPTLIATSGDQITPFEQLPPRPTAPIAGPNIDIRSEQQRQTIIKGTSFGYEPSSLMFRWLEGTAELSSWSPVGPNFEAYLDLSTVPLFSGVGGSKKDTKKGNSGAGSD